MNDLGKDKNDLLTELTAYTGRDYYPFHMPGHKRNTELCGMGNPYGLDITEIDGFDNLHDAQGILNYAMKEAAELYDAEETYFLINGSTCGILAAIHACTKQGDMVLVARNCHKSVYHAMYLRQLVPVYLCPRIWQGISMGVSPEDVAQALRTYPEIRAVMIVSPTYEGIVSPVREIAEIVHDFGCPFIVDEAHGAHFGFAEGFPETAVRLGADLVIQSVHKTLPALTQSALLHLGSGQRTKRKGYAVDRERLQRYLSIFQSSSPSYLLMAGIQNSLRIVKEQKDVLFPRLLENIAFLHKKTEKLQCLSLLSLKNSDPSKLVIFIKPSSGRNGHWLYRILLKKYHLQMEMESLWYVLAMTGIADRREGFERLSNALQEIDAHLLSCRERKGQGMMEEEQEKEETGCLLPPQAGTIQKALDSPKEQCLLDSAIGHISADYLSFYPPGIPVLVPGKFLQKKLFLR